MVNNRQTLDYLIDLFTPEIKDVFLSVIQDIVDESIITDMIKAIEIGDPIAAFQAVGFSPAALRPISQAVDRAFERGGILTGEEFPKYLNTPSGRTVFRFDVRNSRAEGWLRDHSSELVTRLTDEARSNVKTVLERGMIAGDNPRKTALDIVGRIDPVTKQRTGGIIGLTNNQEQWVANTRRDLLDLNERYFTRTLRDKRFDGIVKKAIESGKPLTSDQIDKITIAYKNKALKYRADSIARTESIQALNRAEWEAHMQAVDLGALKKSAVTRHWDSAGDNRVRHSHKAMDSKYKTVGVEIDEPFVSPSGARMMFPGDTSLGAPAEEVIHCRCRVRLKADFLAGWND